jgi:hypothetical protein
LQTLLGQQTRKQQGVLTGSKIPQPAQLEFPWNPLRLKDAMNHGKFGSMKIIASALKSSNADAIILATRPGVSRKKFLDSRHPHG